MLCFSFASLGFALLVLLVVLVFLVFLVLLVFLVMLILLIFLVKNGNPNEEVDGAPKASAHASVMKASAPTKSARGDTTASVDSSSSAANLA